MDYLDVRAERQRMARDWRPGQPVPDIAYSAEEDELWLSVFGKLTSLHEDLACTQYRQSARRVALPPDRIPQLREVSARLAPLTGFQLVPAAGVVPSRLFYAPFADGLFQATQYLRPTSALFHSPEPDVIHELVGHAAMLADPEFAEIYRCFGDATRSADSDEAMDAISRLFWFTIETGVVMENGQPCACGAAILSSVAELESFRHVELRDFRVQDVTVHDFDDSDCQPVLFVAESVKHMMDEVKRFLGKFADAAHSYHSQAKAAEMRLQVSITEQLQDYVADVSLREPEVLRELRKETSELPERNMQVSPEEGQFLNVLVRAIGARRALEVGVFTGYSLVSTALALPEEGTVIACDISEQWASVALEYCRRAGVADKVDLRVGDARQTLAALVAMPGAAGTFDFVFLDADKPSYDTYFEAALTLLRPGGLIVADNVLWSGHVADESVQDQDTRALRAFNAKLSQDDRVDISMIPFADGLTLAVKR